MNKRIVISGATGFLGQALVPLLLAKNYDVAILSRDPRHSQKVFPSISQHLQLTASCEQELVETVNASFAVLNLAGANVSQGRWTDAHKKILMDSRVETTKILVQAILLCSNKPNVLVSASAIGYYGDTGDTICNESTPPANDFLARICMHWESAALKAETVCRVVVPRIGVVLDKREGVLGRLAPLFKMFVGGPLGSGKQWVSWIHRDDLVNALIFCLEHPTLHGAINCVAPEPTRMNELASHIGRSLHRPSLFRVPEWVLRLVLGEQHSIVTAGQRVSSSKLHELGFQFEHPMLKESIDNLLHTE